MKFKIGALILISIAITVFTASVHATGLNVALGHKFNINGGSVNTLSSVVKVKERGHPLEGHCQAQKIPHAEKT